MALSSGLPCIQESHTVRIEGVLRTAYIVSMKENQRGVTGLDCERESPRKQHRQKQV